MVRTENGKLIIEISLEENDTPVKRLMHLKGIFHDMIAEHDYNNFGSMTTSWFMTFTKELELSENQIKL